MESSTILESAIASQGQPIARHEVRGGEGSGCMSASGATETALRSC